ncbi:HGxxPAAW family protein [Streptomyces glaucescens]|uniref:HGxxPAAW family protein n=1 Tax=Streptomyces glaucescens TaxID=1907 RepID=UPI00344D9A19
MFIHGDDPHDLGHTLAGWTGTAVATLGSGVCGLGVIMTSVVVALAGVGVLALALVVTWVLHLAGWGKPGGPRPVEQWDWRVRDTSARAGHPDCLGCRLAGRRGATDGRRAAEARPRATGLDAVTSTSA